MEPQKNFNIKSFEYELAKLIKKQFILVENELCQLPGIKYVNWEKNKNTTKKLIKKNKIVFKTLNRIPWIKFIGITGSAAAYNSNEDSDLDIFIITTSNRVWLTRGLIAIILKLIFKNYVVKGIDPNIFIDESHLTWPKEQQNLYTANEIVRMLPVIDKENTYFRFLEENKWVEDYIGNFKINNYQKDDAINKKQQGDEFLNLLDNFAMGVQKIYMKRKITTEIVKKHFIHFNKNDSTNPVLSKYQEKISTL